MSMSTYGEIRMDKRAFMKTMEAFLAIIIVFTFVIFFMPRDFRTSGDQSVYRLQHLERDDVFRDCVMERNESCISSIIEDVFEGGYSFDFALYEFSEPATEYDGDNVNVYTWFFAGTHERFSPIHFKLFYWDKDLDLDTPVEFLPPGEDDPEDPSLEPVFELSNLRPNPSTIVEGGTLDLLVDVENTGDVSGDYTASFFVEGNLAGTNTVTVSYGDTETASISHSESEADTYAFSVDDLQSSFTVSEEGEEPDFTFSNLRAEPDEVYEGEDISLMLDVENTGGSAGEHTVQFYVNGTLVGEYTVEVGAGDTATASITHSEAEAGSYELTAEGLDAGFVVSSGFSPFIMTIETTEENEEFILPAGDGNFDYEIDWGDGTTEEFTDAGSKTHTYSDPGHYDIRIIGQFPHMDQGDSGNTPEKIIDVKQWGSIEWESMVGMFKRASNLEGFSTTDAPNLSQVYDMSNMFRYASIFNNDLTSWCVENIEEEPTGFAIDSDLEEEFKPIWGVCPAEPNFTAYVFDTTVGAPGQTVVIDIDNIETNEWEEHGASMNATIDWGDGEVTNVSQGGTYLHTYAEDGVYKALIYGEFTSLGTWYEEGEHIWWEIEDERTKLVEVRRISNDVKFYLGTFWAASNLEFVPRRIPGGAKEFVSTFESASNFNHPNIKHWDMSDATTIRRMFRGALSFNQDINDWDVSRVTDMEATFRFARDFNGDITDWETGNVTNMRWMFTIASTGSSVFNQDISGWDVSNVTDMREMFAYSEAFNQNLSGWCVENIEEEPNLFATGSALEPENYPIWGTCPLTPIQEYDYEHIYGLTDPPSPILNDTSMHIDPNHETTLKPLGVGGHLYFRNLDELPYWAELDEDTGHIHVTQTEEPPNAEDHLSVPFRIYTSTESDAGDDNEATSTINEPFEMDITRDTAPE